MSTATHDTAAPRGLGLFFIVSSALTLAKCVRDLHETDAVNARVDEARLQQLLASHDPFRQPVL